MERYTIFVLHLEFFLKCEIALKRKSLEKKCANFLQCLEFFLKCKIDPRERKT